jgi:hypothetical protein
MSAARSQTETTKEVYKKNLIRLNDGKDIKNYNFLKKTDLILKKIEHLKPNSQRSYLISIVSTLKDLKGFDMVRKYYYNLMMQMNKDLKVNNTKSETQLDNWISQDEVMQVWQNLYDKVYPLLQLKKVNEKEWDEILNFIILSLYTLNSPRRNKDFQVMLYLNAPKDLGENFKDFNYMDKDNFLYYNYKTKNSYNLQEIPISPVLLDLLKLYLKLHPLKKSKNPYLLVHYNGQPLDKVNDITRILNKIFNKKIGVSMLRNIYLTDKFKEPMNELKATANAMGTSSATIENNYIKTDESKSLKDLINV